MVSRYEVKIRKGVAENDSVVTAKDSRQAILCKMHYFLGFIPEVMKWDGCTNEDKDFSWAHVELDNVEYIFSAHNYNNVRVV